MYREIEPPACPPSVVAGPLDEPVFPDGAAIVQPITDEEREATASFLEYVAETLRILRYNFNVAQTAKEHCQ